MSAIYSCPQCLRHVLRDTSGHRRPLLYIRSYCERTGRNAVLRLLVGRPTVGDVARLSQQESANPHTEAR